MPFAPRARFSTSSNEASPLNLEFSRSSANSATAEAKRKLSDGSLRVMAASTQGVSRRTLVSPSGYFQRSLTVKDSSLATDSVFWYLSGSTSGWTSATFSSAPAGTIS